MCDLSPSFKALMHDTKDIPPTMYFMNQPNNPATHELIRQLLGGLPSADDCSGSIER